MAFYGYKGDVGECYWNPYNSSTCDYDYDVVPPQASVTYPSSFSFEEPKLIEHCPYRNFDSSATQQVPNYLVYNYSEPKVIQQEPPSYNASASFYSQTYYSISNSATEFNEPEFEEYDPTPYGGGYNITQTYGKPLPPSDAICYPRSAQTNAQLPDGFSYGCIRSPYADDDIHSDGGKDSEVVDIKDKQTHGDNGGGNTENIDIQKPVDVKSGEVDEHSSSDYSNDRFGDGGTIGDGYDWNRQVPYTPYGSGLEAVDLCESIFGYWPCLDKMNRQRNANCEACRERSQNEPWKSTADYLFGSPCVYGEQKDGGNGYYVYGNEGYYQYQPQYPFK